MRRFILFTLLILVGSLALLATVVYLSAGKEIPRGEGGAAAHQLAKRVVAATAAGVWHDTAALYFEVDGAGRSHLRDFDRSYGEVRYWDGADPMRILFALDPNNPYREASADSSAKRPHYRVFRGDEELSGRAAETLYRQALLWQRRDLFELLPQHDLMRLAEWAELEEPPLVVERIGRQALLLLFRHGTPFGRSLSTESDDAVLLILDGEGRPTHWQLWVEQFPVDATEASFGEWQQLESGAKVSLRREGRQGGYRFSNLILYDEYPGEGQLDRFADLEVKSDG